MYTLQNNSHLSEPLKAETSCSTMILCYYCEKCNQVLYLSPFFHFDWLLSQTVSCLGTAKPILTIFSLTKETISKTSTEKWNYSWLKKSNFEEKNPRLKLFPNWSAFNLTRSFSPHDKCWDKGKKNFPTVVNAV